MGVPPQAGSGLRPFGAEPQDASQAEPLVPNAAEANSMRRNLLMGAQVCLIAAEGALQWAHDNSDEDRIAAAIWRELLNIMQARKLIHAASAIEVRSDATGTGAAEGESAVPKADAPKVSQ